jgi:DNA-binding beta-propeller fold protein YncE
VGHPQIAAFARLANGGAKPTRAIAGQHTLFNRTIHGMAYDPVRDEILVPAYHGFAILTFRGDADGDASPVRKIFGKSTQLLNPTNVSIDPVHGEIFVAQGNRVLVFPRDGNGDVAPLRILEGPDTGFLRRPNDNQRVSIDPVRNLLIVSGAGGIRIFDRTANGNVKPLRFITGPGATDVRLLTNNPDNGMIFGAVRAGEVFGGASGEDISGRYALDDYVGVWSVYDNGNAPPRLTIGGPNLLLKDARGITMDPKNKNVIVSDKTLNAVLTFHVPEAF